MIIDIFRVSAKSGNSGKNKGNGLCLKRRKNQGIQLMLAIIREISWEIFAFFSSISQSPNMLKKLARRHIMPTMSVFICHDGNRAHHTEIGKNLLK